MDGYLIIPVFLVQTLFGLYILLVLLRFVLQWVRADFYNPVSQFLVKLTNPPLKPLRRLIPGWGGIDIASIVLMFALQMAAVVLILLIQGQSPGLPGVFLVSVRELAALFFNVFIFSILIQAVLSWVNPGTYSPITGILYSLNEPVLRPIRRVVPPVSGFDLSPLFAIIGLQVVKMAVVLTLQ